MDKLSDVILRSMTPKKRYEYRQALEMTIAQTQGFLGRVDKLSMTPEQREAYRQELEMILGQKARFLEQLNAIIAETSSDQYSSAS